MPLERVVGEANLRPADLQDVGEIRLASKTRPGSKLIADLIAMPAAQSGFTAAGKATLTVMVDDVDDPTAHDRVLRRLGIHCESQATVHNSRS